MDFLNQTHHNLNLILKIPATVKEVSEVSATARDKGEFTNYTFQRFFHLTQARRYGHASPQNLASVEIVSSLNDNATKDAS